MNKLIKPYDTNKFNDEMKKYDYMIYLEESLNDKEMLTLSINYDLEIVKAKRNKNVFFIKMFIKDKNIKARDFFTVLSGMKKFDIKKHLFIIMR